ncbi:hypothetical protein Tco_0332774 [Tanacetum coccineum]
MSNTREIWKVYGAVDATPRFDGGAWKKFDMKYPDFAKEPRNVRLGLCADGFNPFGNLSQTYSMWPVILTTYNLPPWLCMKESNFMLTLLIPSPKSPGKDIDVYLRPLIEDLQVLEFIKRAYVLHNSPEIDTYRAQFQRSVKRQANNSKDPGLAQTNGYSLATGPSRTPSSHEILELNICRSKMRCSELSGTDIATMMADVARAHGGDGGGEDPSRPPPTSFGCAGCFINRGKGKRKPNLGGVKAGRKTRERTRNQKMTSATQEEPSEIDTFYRLHTVYGCYPRSEASPDDDRMRELEATGEHTTAEINAMVQGGKLPGHIPGVGPVMPEYVRSRLSYIAPFDRSGDVDFMMSLMRSDNRFADAFARREGEDVGDDTKVPQRHVVWESTAQVAQFLTKKYVGPFSLGIVAGERFAIELTPSTFPQRHFARDRFPQRHFARDRFPQRHVAGERVGMLLGKASNVVVIRREVVHIRKVDIEPSFNV